MSARTNPVGNHRSTVRPVGLRGRSAGWARLVGCVRASVWEEDRPHFLLCATSRRAPQAPPRARSGRVRSSGPAPTGRAPASAQSRARRRSGRRDCFCDCFHACGGTPRATALATEQAQRDPLVANTERPLGEILQAPRGFQTSAKTFTTLGAAGSALTRTRYVRPAFNTSLSSEWMMSTFWK